MELPEYGLTWQIIIHCNDAAYIRVMDCSGGRFMAVCIFLGHRDCPETVKPYLREVPMDLITSKGADT